MSAFADRRDEDLRKLRELQQLSRERIRVTRVSGQPTNKIDVDLFLKTAPSTKYPGAVQDVTKLTISLPDRYPFVEPAVKVKTPILHPNVYTSGLICLGVKWLPSLGLDFLIKRIVQIVTFDPTILNEASPANRNALTWYREARRTHPDSFPTDALNFSTPEPKKTMKWTDVSPKPAKTIVPCPKCLAKLSLPTGRRGQVRCPKCNAAFETTT